MNMGIGMCMMSVGKNHDDKKRKNEGMAGGRSKSTCT